jgi:ion channel-forming bestrophin family protein
MLLRTKISLTYILNKVKYDLIYVLSFSIIVYFVSKRYSDWLPVINMSIPAFIGTAISILLSFKLNQSYERWWEARKIWGSIVNDSRTFVVQLKNFLPKELAHTVKKMAYRQIAWCYVLGRSLRNQEALHDMDKLLDEEELTRFQVHKNKPLAMIDAHSSDLSKLANSKHLDVFQRVHIDQTLVRFCDHMGRAERIKSTVFPVTYRLFLHFTIYLFVAILAISLRDIPIYYQTPLSLLISLVFLLLEKSAKHMQDPFENRPTDTAMTAIARTIEINIRQLLDEKEVPEPYPANGYYLL